MEPVWNTFDATTKIVIGARSGWTRGVGGVQWFVEDRDGKRREGRTKTAAGAKSAITQVRRRMGLDA